MRVNKKMYFLGWCEDELGNLLVDASERDCIDFSIYLLLGNAASSRTTKIIISRSFPHNSFVPWLSFLLVWSRLDVKDSDFPFSNFTIKRITELTSSSMGSFSNHWWFDEFYNDYASRRLRRMSKQIPVCKRKRESFIMCWRRCRDIKKTDSKTWDRSGSFRQTGSRLDCSAAT